VSALDLQIDRHRAALARERERRGEQPSAYAVSP